MSRNTDRMTILRNSPVWIASVLLGACLWLLTLALGESARAWQAFLVNFSFFVPLAAGLVVWVAIVRASHGTWLGTIEETALKGQVFALPSLVALLMLWAASPAWAPWAGKSHHQGLWLNTHFIFLRDFLALAGFWALSYRYGKLQNRSQHKGAAAILVLVFCITFSLLGFDLVMALDPEWVSSLFGGYFFTSSLYIAMAALTFIVTRNSTVSPARLHDLGKLLLAFSILTTYMFYCQLLPIYYENLPRETRFVAPRIQEHPWHEISILLVALVFLGPLVLLLTIWAKRHRHYLGFVAALLLGGMWIERWWLIIPSINQHFSPGLPELGASLLFLGIWGLSLQFSSRRQNQTKEKSA